MFVYSGLDVIFGLRRTYDKGRGDSEAEINCRRFDTHGFRWAKRSDS